MKTQYLLIFLVLLTFYGCYQDCTPQDIKVGEKNLMAETQAFMQKFIGKKVVFKNELGKEMIFRDTGSLRHDIRKFDVHRNCNAGLWEVDQSYDYLEIEGYSLELISDSLNLRLTFQVTWDVFSVGRDSTKLYDDLSLRIGHRTQYCSVGIQTIFSSRGHTNLIKDLKNYPTYQFRTIKDTIVNNKSFQNISFKANAAKEQCLGLYLPTQITPYEMLFNLKDGLLAFKTVNNEFWVFDRIE